ncbi:MAG: AraC family transcriptional regulator [Saprospirales bacterium]|nr:MAG: AraC family transcriptional regulator [Saprospirales bacterium]
MSGLPFRGHLYAGEGGKISSPTIQTIQSVQLSDSLVMVTHHQFPVPDFDNHLRTIYKESEELIWLASRTGIYQFDGENVGHFASLDVQAQGINKMRTDQNGDIWCWRNFVYRNNPIRSLILVNRKEGTAMDGMYFFEGKSGQENIEFGHIDQLHDHSLVFNTTDGRVFILSDRKNIEEVPLDQPTRFLGELDADHWIGKTEGEMGTRLKIYDYSGRERATTEATNSTDHLINCHIKNGELVCVEWKHENLQILVFQLQNDRLKLIETVSPPPNMGFIEDPIMFFLERETHVDILTFDGRQFNRHETLSRTQEEVIGGSLPSPIVKGKKGYWIASSTGIHSISGRKHPFNSLLHRTDETPISFRKIAYIDSTTALAASYSGLYTIDLQVPNNPLASGPDENLSDCMGPFIHSFAASKLYEGFFYFGMANFARYNPTTGECALVVDLKNKGIVDLWDIVHLWDHYYYLGTDRGLYLFDESEKSFTKITLHAGDDAATTSTINRIRFIPEEELLYLCTSNGLIVADLKSGNPESPVINHLLKPRRNVNDIVFLDDGSLLISTWGDGIILLSYPGFNKITHFNTNNFLKSNSTHNLMRDQIGRIWFSANHGLYLYDHKEGVIRIFTEINGLRENEFNHLALAVPPTREHPTILGGINGLSLFFPEKISLYDEMIEESFIGIRLNDRNEETSSYPLYSVDQNGFYAVQVPASAERLTFKLPLESHLQVHNLYFRFQNGEYEWTKTDSDYLPIQMLDPGQNTIEILLEFQDHSLVKLSKPLSISHSPASITALQVLIATGFLGCLILIWWAYLAQYKKPEEKEDAANDHPPLERTDQAKQILKPTPEKKSELSVFIEKFEAIEKKNIEMPAYDPELKKRLNQIFEEDEEFIKEVTVDLLAKKINISKRHIFRKVKDATGLTPNKYILNLRISKGRLMLQENPDLNISEVALNLGYDKTSYFSKLFKNIYGMSPSQFRESYLKLLEAENHQTNP